MTSRFLLAFKPFISIIPEVRKPDHELTFKRKVLFTVGVLVLYYLLSLKVLLFAGVAGIDPFGFIRMITASSSNSLAELGILPILIAGLIMYTLIGLKVIKVDNDNQSERLLYNGLMKILAFILTIGGGILVILSGHFGLHLNFVDQIFIFLQIFIGGTIIIYLDEIIRKGWGYGSGISLFIVGMGLGKIVEGLLAPNNILEGLQGVTSAKGIILAFLYWVGEEGPVAAIGNLMFRYNSDPSHNLFFPSLSIFSIILTCVLFLSVIYLETRQKNANFHSETSKKAFLTPLIPLLLVATVFAAVRFISYIFWQASGGQSTTNPLASILGTFRPDTFIGLLVPTGGFVYYLTPTFSIFEGILIDPVTTIIHVLIYSTLFLLLFRWFTKMGLNIMGLNPDEQIAEEIKNRGIKIAVIAIIADIFNPLGLGLGLVLLALLLIDYYKLFTKKEDPSFARFDISSPDEQIIEKTEFKPIKERTYWIIIVLLGMGLQLLRFVIFVILGREL